MAKKILVIDDDQLVIKTLARYLKTCGYTAEVVSSGEEAVKKAESNPYDLVIADIRMPGMDGIETIKKIREICQRKYNKKTPEIIITGFASDDKKKEAQEMGIEDYIFKPFDVSVFIEAIRRNLKE